MDFAHDRNIPYIEVPPSSPDYKQDWNKCVATEWNEATRTLNFIDYLRGSDDPERRKLYETKLKWQVDGNPIEGYTKNYGGKPPIGEVTRLMVTVSGDNGLVIDQMLFTVVPPGLSGAYETWYNSNANDTAWLSLIPSAYSALGSGFSDPEPPTVAFWESPSSFLTIANVMLGHHFFHYGASYEMRAETIHSYGDCAHQACYDFNGDFIAWGVAAGSADRHPAGTLGHLEQDVKPFIQALQLDGNPVMARAAYYGLTDPMIYQGGYLKMYSDVRPPIGVQKRMLSPGETP